MKYLFTLLLIVSSIPTFAGKEIPEEALAQSLAHVLSTVQNQLLDLNTMLNIDLRETPHPYMLALPAGYSELRDEIYSRDPEAQLRIKRKAQEIVLQNLQTSTSQRMRRERSGTATRVRGAIKK